MKKTLLIAAAALAASVISSQAQVYSQNIVGYANIPTPASGAQYLIAVPFKVGVTNGANEVFGSTLPDFSTLLVWSTAANNYTLYYADSGSATLWDDSNFTPINAPLLPVGQGFFLSPSGNNVTNTFAGAIAINVGTSNVMSLPTAGAQYLVSPVVPYAGSLTNGTSSGGGANLNGLPDFSTVLVWSTAANNYTLYYSDSGSGTLWDDSNFTPVAAPNVQVGQGFFVSPSGAATWTTGL
jgi:hypothetical protein